MRFLIVAAALVATITLCRATAEARSLVCPAILYGTPGMPATSAGQSTSFVYELDAASPKSILSATLIADTDGGWYTWKVSHVAITPGLALAQSPLLVVDFPRAVFVRHAWILRAATSGDALWDAYGETACGVPAFGGPSFRPAKPRPSDNLPSVVAVTVSPPPFSTDCARPFASATVTRAVRPSYPESALRGSYTAAVEVTVGENDDLIGAHIYKSSKNAAIDASALAAAQASSYQSAVSYCQKTIADYLFKAEFGP
jgi:TonB family protein